MVLRILPAQKDDLVRVGELIERTSQLNSTGYVYTFDELLAFSNSPDHALVVADLRDKFGESGRVGLALIDLCANIWVLNLLVVSCRVMSRGIGAALLGEILRQAAKAGCRVRARFVPTDRNRIMMITYRFAGFREIDRDGELIILEHDAENLPDAPQHLKLCAGDAFS
jgi:FkbH-like protein